jgi:hypothetical protein
MRFFKLTVLLIFLPFLSFGQTKEIAVVNREVIKKNKIYKCLEYDFQDSVSFFKKYKNGYYTIFDTQGRKVEENAYSSLNLEALSSEIVSEFQVIYSYDKLGRRYMWHWYQESSNPKINRTRIEKYDSIGRNIGYCEHSPNYGERCETYNNGSNVLDSITVKSNSLTQKIFLTFYDLSRKDTIYKNFYFYNKEQLDSNVLIHFENGKLLEKLTTKYYYIEGALHKTELVRLYKNQITETNFTYYLKNGLLDRIETIRYYFSPKRSETRVDKDYRKFVYSHWK